MVTNLLKARLYKVITAIFLICVIFLFVAYLSYRHLERNPTSSWQDSFIR